jgi:ABC-type transport system substrate-binding protein
MDALIEKSRQTMNPDERLQLLQTIMGKIDDELIGIPLFEASRLYAVRKGIQWEPRLDGLVLATEVK